MSTANQRVDALPLFMIKKEVFAWLKEGAKTIDVRKGPARRGEIALFQCGPICLEFSIIRKETGKLAEVVRKDNYKQIIKTATNLEEALDYFKKLYRCEDALFTAYYLSKSNRK